MPNVVTPTHSMSSYQGGAAGATGSIVALPRLAPATGGVLLVVLLIIVGLVILGLLQSGLGG